MMRSGSFIFSMVSLGIPCADVLLEGFAPFQAEGDTEEEVQAKVMAGQYRAPTSASEEAMELIGVKALNGYYTPSCRG